MYHIYVFIIFLSSFFAPPPFAILAVIFELIEQFRLSSLLNACLPLGPISPALPPSPMHVLHDWDERGCSLLPL